MKKFSDNFPILLSNRLRLRPFRLDECESVTDLINHPEVIDPLMAVRYPYSIENARAWISKHSQTYADSGGLNFAIEERKSGQLAGFVGMGGSDTEAGMGYWYGKRFWGKGFATEAGRTVIAFGFEELELARVEASHISTNITSGKVLQKIGMELFGRKSYFYEKWDQNCDKDEYSISREIYDTCKNASPNDYLFEIE